MKITPIASGSSGNCVCVSGGDSAFLIDAGISKKRIEQGIAVAGVLPEDLSGILITHEHIDHIKGLGVFTRKYALPVYATAGTIRGILREQSLGAVDAGLFHPVCPDQSFSLGSFSVTPVSIKHDAADPVAYRFSTGGSNGAVVTDLGIFDEYIIDSFQDLDAIMIEANHDVTMLKYSTYPPAVKARILSEYGHLSNESAGILLSRIVSGRLKHVILGHLSHENNEPALALQSVRGAMEEHAANTFAGEVHMFAARRDAPSETVEV